jgi:dihydroxyacid dehydratase/phosphogluconate dehydratase
MRSETVKIGYQRAPNRALLRSLGVTDREMDQPFIGIANAYTTHRPRAHPPPVPLAEGAGGRGGGGRGPV